MSSARTWRLSSRVARWCLAIGTAFVAFLALVGGGLVHFEAQDSLDAITDEELVEMVAAFEYSPCTPEGFARAAEALQRSHPDDAFAWRVWNLEDGSVWGTFGREELRPRIPASWGEAPRIGSAMRWSTRPLVPGLGVGLFLEGGREIASVRRFWIVAAATIGIAAGLSWLAGRFLGLRISGSLESIAAEWRADAQPNERDGRYGELPLEIRDVVAAMRESTSRIRRESDRARLLASGLAHELRTPLQSLLMRSELALRRNRSSEEHCAAFREQVRDIRELTVAIDNLVTLCAPREARAVRHCAIFDYSAEARLRLRNEIERAEETGRDLCLELPEDLACSGDRDGLMLALRNLVANGLEWCTAGGQVRVSVDRDGDEIRLVVEDDGPGVPREARERVFEPFQQVERQGRQGYGLGLALVRAVADAHGGAVGLDDSPLGGARFTFSWPGAVSEDGGEILPSARRSRVRTESTHREPIRE